MRKVVDSNYLKDEDLRKYLKESAQNYVLLSYPLNVEIFKPKDKNSIRDFFSILAHYPKQVLVLKNDKKILRYKMRTSDLISKLIDTEQTNNFPNFCNKINTSLEDPTLHENMEVAQGELIRILELVVPDKQIFRETVKSHFNNEEIKMIRNGSDWTEGMLQKELDYIFILSRDVFEEDFNVDFLSYEIEEMVNSYVFRFSLCSYKLAIYWIKHGQVSGGNNEKSRNTVVDTQIAAHATYFDGLLTKDQGCRWVYASAIDFLRSPLLMKTIEKDELCL